MVLSVSPPLWGATTINRAMSGHFAELCGGSAAVCEPNPLCPCAHGTERSSNSQRSKTKRKKDREREREREIKKTREREEREERGDIERERAQLWKHAKGTPPKGTGREVKF